MTILDFLAPLFAGMLIVGCIAAAFAERFERKDN